jgi:predicted aspartyl protease
MKNLYWVIVLFLLASCDYLTQVRLLKNGEVGASNYLEDIPFELKKGLIVVQAKLNGDSKVREFIFDTGAFDCKIEKTLAESLAMPTLATRDNSTAAGVSREIEITRVDALQLGEIPFWKLSAGKLEYDEKSASPCLAPHGLIGANLIRLAHWKIDFLNKKLSFSDSAFQPERFETQYRIPFSHEKLTGIPEISMMVGGKSVEGLIFDLGYNGGIVLPLSLAHQIPGELEKVILDQSTTGIFGSNQDSLLIKKVRVNLGGFVQEIPVEFSSLGKGLIGTDFLKHFEILMDYHKKEITLLPREEVQIPEGLDFIPGISPDGLWVVNRTTPDLPLQLGQKIRRINGSNANEVFPTHCDYVLGIRDFLVQEILELEMEDGSIIRIRQ